MCAECGCNIFGMAYMEPVSIIETSTDGESGLTLDMTSTPTQRESFIEEVPLHEMGEGMVDPD
jgi:hypothetical protein